MSPRVLLLCTIQPLYSDIEETVDILTHSADSWSLCDNASLLSENPNIRSDKEFDGWMIEDTQRMVHQGMFA